jgi:Putative sensor
VSLAFIFAPLVEVASRFSWFGLPNDLHSSPAWLDSLWAAPFLVLVGVLLFTVLMHLARGIGRLHAMYAKALLVAPMASAAGQ